MSIEELIKEHVASEVARVLPSLLPEPKRVESPWMLAKEAAEYMRLVNKEGEATTSSLLDWTKRAPKDNPLPYSMVGDMRRYHRDDLDKWMRREAERNRNKLRAVS